MRLMKFAGIALAVAVMVSGCATPSRNFAPDDVMVSKSRVNAEMKSVSVVISDDETIQTGYGPGGADIVEPYKIALENALIRSAIFDDEAKTKITVKAKLLKIKTLGLGFDVETVSTVNYQIISGKDGKVLYETEVTQSGLSPLGENFMWITRLKNSLNRSGQNNIKEFIRRLEAVAPKINETIQKMTDSTK